MGDSNSFTSLMAMVESHLSKTSLPTSQDGGGQAGPTFSLPNICGAQNSNSQQFLLPPATAMQLPRLEVKNNEVTEILAQQVRNMLMAKENSLNEENEKQRLADDFESMKLKDSNKDNNYVIDLSASIITPGKSQLQQAVECSTLSHSSSMESLLSEIDKDIANKLQEPQEEPLPTCEDMSYILYQRVKQGKCSSFGKVLGSRVRPAFTPYLRMKIPQPAVVPFDFSTPSPCDINTMRRLHHPVDAQYLQTNTSTYHIMDITKEEKS